MNHRVNARVQEEVLRQIMLFFSTQLFYSEIIIGTSLPDTETFFIATLNDVIFHFISLLSLFDFPIFPHFQEPGKCKSKNTLHKVQQQLALASNNFF